MYGPVRYGKVVRRIRLRSLGIVYFSTLRNSGGEGWVKAQLGSALIVRGNGFKVQGGRRREGI